MEAWAPGAAAAAHQDVGRPPCAIALAVAVEGAPPISASLAATLLQQGAPLA